MKNKAKCCLPHRQAGGINLGPTADILRTISEPNRLKMLCFLKSGPKCVCEIQAAFKLTHNLACHHLKELKKTKIVRSKKQGGFTFYELDKKIYNTLVKNINKLLGGKNV